MRQLIRLILTYKDAPKLKGLRHALQGLALQFQLTFLRRTLRL